MEPLLGITQYIYMYIALISDHNADSSSKNNPLFAMSGDGKDDVSIPLVFVFHAEGQRLMEMWNMEPALEVVLTFQPDTLSEYIIVQGNS